MARIIRKRYVVNFTAPNRPQFECGVEAVDASDAISLVRELARYSFDGPPLDHDEFSKVGVGKTHTVSRKTSTRYKTDGSKARTVSTAISMSIVCLGEVPRRKYTKEERVQRRKAREAERQARAAEKEAWRKEQAEQQRIRIAAYRQQIVNQIELAYEKKLKDALHYLTCEHCAAKAAWIIVDRPPEGTAIQFDSITGALCANHYHPQYDKRPVVHCTKVEFFYDGLRHLHINKAA